MLQFQIVMNYNSYLPPSVLHMANPTLEDDLLTLTVFNTIDQVNKSEEVKSVIVMGIVISILPALEWYYNACSRCNKRVTRMLIVSDTNYGTDGVEANHLIQCLTEACHFISVVPRFRVPLQLQDCTGIDSLRMFDHDS
ncbi:uncharacterized protein LOC143576455 [Bidens hawaiensis]|uniref:uncharacterized protein LOC143576455 n=1 Tax=Bidens hawaiensis TaxID=980011 RepID=UPI0040499F46